MTRSQLAKLIQAAARELYDVDQTAAVQYAEPGFGDFSSNAAFQLAKAAGKPPREVAAELAARLQHPDIENAEAAGAGFINVTLKPQVWAKQLQAVKPGYAKNGSGQGRKVQVEFISANPTGPTTFGNARGGFIGDAIARVLDHSGWEVVREYYFNDGGTQIGKLVESVKVAAGLITAEDVQYTGEYVRDLADEFKDELATASDEEAARILTTAILKRYIEPAVAKMKVSYDVWFNERSLKAEGKVDEALAALKKHDLVYDKDGATWLASSRLGDERDRVLVKSGGDLTYLANDIAYHLDIFTGRKFDRAIKEWGADHAGQVPSLRLVMQQLAPGKSLDFVLHQWVRLIKDGREYKISKRAGTYVTVEEVLDLVGSDVARFFFLMRAADSHMDFDLDLAAEQSAKNPYYYVMYAYARANSILAKANERGLKPAGRPGELAPLETELAKQMAQLPELVTDLADNFEVHRLTFFAQAAAATFQNWYESGRIIDLPSDEAAQKLFFVQQFVVFMEEIFQLLGLEPQRRMGSD